jgi:hypothetical protein
MAGVAYNPFTDPNNTELRHIPTPPKYNPYNDPYNTELQTPQVAKGNPALTAPSTVNTVIQQVAAPGYDPTNQMRTSAFADMKLMLDQWGLGDLAGWAQDLYQGPNAPTTFNEFYLALKQQPIYVKRFGDTNDQRIKAGLPALSEKGIMDLESSYKKTMASYGLPAAFYDQPDDFKKFIVNDLSAAEVADRVQAASSFVKLQDPTIKQQLAQYYGINDGALTAAALDPAKGQTIIEQLASKNTTAIAAGTAGLSINDANTALGMGAGEMAFNKQAQAFGQSAETGRQGADLSAIYAGQGAQQYGVQQALGEYFNGANAAQEQSKRKRLGKMEENAFGGSSGVGAGSLGVDQTAGSL